MQERVQQGFHAGDEQDIDTGDSWKWARQESGPLPLLKQALEALQEHAKQPFFRHVLVTNDPHTLLQRPGASLAQVLSDLDRVRGIQKYCDAVTAAIARAQAGRADVGAGVSLWHHVDANGTPNMLHDEKNLDERPRREKLRRKIAMNFAMKFWSPRLD